MRAPQVDGVGDRVRFGSMASLTGAGGAALPERSTLGQRLSARRFLLLSSEMAGRPRGSW
jgi:hypothetical protein